MALNKEWHIAHPMPKNATLQQRIDWHTKHERVCGCRPMPARLREVIRRNEAATPPAQTPNATG